MTIYGNIENWIRNVTKSPNGDFWIHVYTNRLCVWISVLSTYFRLQLAFVLSRSKCVDVHNQSFLAYTCRQRHEINLTTKKIAFFRQSKLKQVNCVLLCENENCKQQPSLVWLSSLNFLFGVIRVYVLTAKADDSREPQVSYLE